MWEETFRKWKLGEIQHKGQMVGLDGIVVSLFVEFDKYRFKSKSKYQSEDEMSRRV